jgi:hypothetical protein
MGRLRARSPPLSGDADLTVKRSLRDYWTVMAFGDHQVAAGRTGELVAARSQAETALAIYMAAWREPSGDESGNG